MENPHVFSTHTIKEKAPSLPDTFYGEHCNVSLRSQSIPLKSAADGEPMRFDHFGISLCCGGEISSEVNLTRQRASKGDFELFSPGTIYRLTSISDDCDLTGIAFSPYFLKDILTEEDMSYFFQVGKNVRVRLEENGQEIFRQMAVLYLRTLQTYGESSGLSKGLASCIMKFAMQVCSSQRAVANETNSRTDELCRRFITLLGESRGTKRTIGWFAEQLCVSNHYLSIAVKQTSNQSVKSLIDNAVITEIKVLLRHSELSVAQIANKLEFPSSSFLCKYFKAQTGMTPLKYRTGK